MGLFEKIFGALRPKGAGATQYRLLSGYDSGLSKYDGGAWDINVVRAAVDAWARNAAKVQPRHIRRYADRREDVPDYINNILQFKPNPYMTAYAFYYKIAAQYMTDNNAFIFPVWDKSGKLRELYPIDAARVELVEVGGDMYARMDFRTGTVWTCPYEQLIHIRRHFKENDVFGADNRPLLPVLETAHTFNASMGKFAGLISVIRGLLRVSTPTKTEDLNKRRDDFIRDNLRIDSGGSGVIVTDAKYDYTPLSERQAPIPVGQLEYIRREVYDYFGVNDAIVQNKASPEEMDAFYRGQIMPFYIQLSQGFTNAIFTERERGFGNEIMFEVSRLQFETLPSKVQAAQFLTNIGAASLDQILDLFGLPPIGGEDGARRVQTLNMVNAARADEYQLGDDPGPDGPKMDKTGQQKEGIS